MYAHEIEFQKWPSIPRLNRNVIVTEKIDGTNAAVVIHRTGILPTAIDDGSNSIVPNDLYSSTEYPHLRLTTVDDSVYYVAAQSRKKFIYPGKQHDNAQFAAWVWDNAATLVRGLGEGVHHGEWYGSKIQSGYGYTDGKRRFMLFNSSRWDSSTVTPELSAIGVEPPTVLYEGVFNQDAINTLIANLRAGGSKHVPGQKAEGVVVYHEAARQTFKVLCENDELSKTEAGITSD